MPESITNAPYLAPLPCNEDVLSSNVKYVNDECDAIACPSTIYCNLPDGFKIDKARIGFGLIATKYFPKYSRLFQSNYTPIKDEYVKLKLITDRCGTFDMDTLTHTMQDGGIRILHTFVSFVNHNCSPNSYFVSEMLNNIITRSFSYYALRDIQPNDEVTIDYCTVIYDTPFAYPTIEPCLCGAERCRGSMRGFKNLSNDDKEKLLPYTDWEVRVAHFISKMEKIEN